MFKRIVVVLLCVFMMVSLAACGVRESLDEKIVEEVTESVADKTGGDVADVDLDGDKITIESKDGEKLTLNDNKWPESGAASLIPKFEKGNIVSTVNSEDACAIMLEQVEGKDFKQYIEDLKAKGFTNNVTEYTNETGQGFNANLDENKAVFILYDSANKAITITFENNI